MLIVFTAIPFINLFDSMGYHTLMERINDKSNPEMTAFLSTLFSTLIIFAVAVIGYIKYLKAKIAFKRKDVMLLFIVYLAAYISVSYIVSGVFAGRFPSNHQLYLVNFIIILWLINKQFNPFFANPASEINLNRWLIYLTVIVFFILLLARISVNTHEVMGGAHERFLN
jgi:hypothetical protein